MAKLSDYYIISQVIFSFNILKSLCIPLQNSDFDNLIQAEVEKFFDQEYKRNDSVHPVEVLGWPKKLPQVGQVVGVGINSNHQPVIFHRGPRVWDETSFNESHHFQQIVQGPISVDTILTLDIDTGEVVYSWGKNFFYLPHGLTIDKYNYHYMTDVGLHQAFKFKLGSKTPSLIFGQKFEPGSGLHHLCKPTDIAVANTGEIFIADGYCNSRILKYDSNGNLLYVLPLNEEFLPMKIPHSVALIEEYDVICIADRENKRIVCPGAGLKSPPSEANPATTMVIQDADMGRIFAVATYGDKLFAVNGPSLPMVQVRGLTIDPIKETIIDQWTTSEGFQNPHDVEVCHNTNVVYVTESGPNRIWKFRLMPLY